MSVALSMDELQAQSPGSVVQVGGVEWERVENGLMRDTVVLGLQHFVGYVTEGKVIGTGETWPPGWYRNGNHWRLVTHRVGDRVHALGFGPRRADPTYPTWAADAPRGRWRRVTEAEQDLWMKRLAAFQQSRETVIPETFVQALHAYAGQANDRDLDDLLTEHGIGRLADHTSQVRISGHSYWTPDAAAVKAWLGDDTWTITGIEDAVTIYWRRTVEITTNGAGCTCGLIDRDRVREFVPTATEDFAWDAVCAPATESFV